MKNQINKIIFKYLDCQNFVVMNEDEYIYFLNFEEDDYPQIRYDKHNGRCNIYMTLVKEISSFFSLGESDSKEVISSWVENTLQMRVTNTKMMNRNQRLVVENT